MPDVFPHAASDGPPKPNQSAAQPCYLDTGVPPLANAGGAPACAKKPQPDFNGRQSFYNSGMLTEDGESFSVKLAEDIRPGTYSFMWRHPSRRNDRHLERSA